MQLNKQMNYITPRTSRILDMYEKFEQGAHTFKRKLLKTEKGVKKYNSNLLENPLKNDFKLPSVSTSDSTYWLQKWEVWENIISHDWIDRKPYIAELNDCDNFAFWFASRAAMIYHLNSAFVCYGGTYNLDGSKRSGHAFNLIPALGDDGIDWYVYEPITDWFVKWEPGEKIIMHNIEYRITWAIGF